MVHQVATLRAGHLQPALHGPAGRIGLGGTQLGDPVVGQGALRRAGGTERRHHLAEQPHHVLAPPEQDPGHLGELERLLTDREGTHPFLAGDRLRAATARLVTAHQVTSHQVAADQRVDMPDQAQPVTAQPLPQHGTGGGGAVHRQRRRAGGRLQGVQEVQVVVMGEHMAIGIGAQGVQPAQLLVTPGRLQQARQGLELVAQAGQCDHQRGGVADLAAAQCQVVGDHLARPSGQHPSDEGIEAAAGRALTGQGIVAACRHRLLEQMGQRVDTLRADGLETLDDEGATLRVQPGDVDRHLAEAAGGHAPATHHDPV